MAISYSIDVDRQLILTVASGTLSDDDLIQFKIRLVRDPDFKAGMCEISDLRDVVNFNITTNGVRRLVMQDEKDARLVRTHKLAIVTSQTIIYGMARMYQTLTQKNIAEVNVFRDIEKAQAWISSK